MTTHDISKLALIQLPISELKPYPRNPREHSEAQIAMLVASIREYGFNAPILISPEREVIAGHGRLEAAKRIGMTAVPAIALPHLDDHQQRAYRIADNAIMLKGSWSLELLAEEFELITGHDVSFDPMVIGFETAEFDGVVGGRPQQAPPETVPLPDRSGSPVARLGDLWSTADGRYRLICGDARDPAAYERLLGSERADMVVSDMPFNVRVDGHVCGLGAVRHAEFQMASGEMSDAEFSAFMKAVLIKQRDFSKPGSVHLQFIDWRSVERMIATGREVHGTFLNLCVWVKSNGGMGSLWRSRHELVCAFRAPGRAHKNNVRLGKHGRNRTNVWEVAGVNAFRKGRMKDLSSHPTCKPVPLIADAIMDVSDRGDLVLDAFLGSGTTLMAAHRTGRRGAGIEIDPHYVDVAIQRFAEATDMTFVHDSGLSFTELKALREKEAAHD